MVKIPPDFYEAVKKTYGIAIGDKLTLYWTSLGSQYKATVILCKINVNTIVGILQEERDGFPVGKKLSAPLRKSSRLNYWTKEGKQVKIQELTENKTRKENIPWKIKKLEKRATELNEKSIRLVENIPAGQPVMSTRHRNTLTKAWDLQRESNNMIKEAEELRGSINELF